MKILRPDLLRVLEVGLATGIISLVSFTNLVFDKQLGLSVFICLKAMYKTIIGNGKHGC